VNLIIEGKQRPEIFVIAFRQPRVKGCLEVLGFEPRPSDSQTDVTIPGHGDPLFTLNSYKWKIPVITLSSSYDGCVGSFLCMFNVATNAVKCFSVDNFNNKMFN